MRQCITDEFGEEEEKTEREEREFIPVWGGKRLQ
jgi:hypothetical protein